MINASVSTSQLLEILDLSSWTAPGRSVLTCPSTGVHLTIEASGGDSWSLKAQGYAEDGGDLARFQSKLDTLLVDCVVGNSSW